MLGPTHRFGGIAFGALTPVVIENFMDKPIHDPLLFMVATIAGGAIGSLIPDIDSPSSTLGRRVKPISKLVADKMGHRGATHSLLALIIFALITTFIGVKLENILGNNMTGRNHIIFAIVVGIILMFSVLFVIESIPSKRKKRFTKKHFTLVVLGVFIVTMYFSYEFSTYLLDYVRVYLLGVVVGYASHIVLDMFTRSGVPILKPMSEYRISFTRLKTGSIIEEITKVLCTVITVISILILTNIIKIS